MAKPKTPHKRILLRLPTDFQKSLDEIASQTGLSMNRTLVGLIRGGIAFYNLERKPKRARTKRV